MTGPLVRRTAWALTLAGSLPLAVAAVAMLHTESRIRVPAIAAMVTYAAVLLSFLGGIEWGVAVRDDTAGFAASEGRRALALALGVLPSLAGWGVLWLPSPQWQLGGSLGLFVLVCLADLGLARWGLVPAWFAKLRAVETVIVAALLGVALWLLQAGG